MQYRRKDLVEVLEQAVVSTMYFDRIIFEEFTQTKNEYQAKIMMLCYLCKELIFPNFYFEVEAFTLLLINFRSRIGIMYKIKEIRIVNLNKNNYREIKKSFSH